MEKVKEKLGTKFYLRITFYLLSPKEPTKGRNFVKLSLTFLGLIVLDCKFMQG